MTSAYRSKWIIKRTRGEIVGKKFLGLFFLMALATVSPARATDEHPHATCTGLENCCDDLTASCPQAEFGGTKVAIVFGADEYQSTFGTDLNDLKNGRNDAAAVGKALAEIGFSVRYVFDPDPSRVLSEVTDFASYLRRKLASGEQDPAESRAVLYFAGHGMSDGNSDYLIYRLKDTSLPENQRFQAARIDTDGISRIFFGMETFDVTLIFDACRTLTTLPKTSDGKFKSTRGNDFVRDSFELSGTEHIVVRSASRLNPASDDSGTGNNGLFVREFAFYVRRPNLTPAQIFALTSSSVYSAGLYQQPDYDAKNARKSTFFPWHSVTAPCETLETTLWTTAAVYCGNGQPAASCQARLCRAWNDSRPETVGDMACMRPDVFDRIGKLDELCAKPPYSTATRKLGRTTAALTDPEQARSIAIAAQPVFAQQFSEDDHALLASATVPAAKPSFVDSEKLRETFLRTSRVTTMSGLPLNNTLTADVKAWPNSLASAVVTAKEATGSSVNSVRVDCDNLKCGDGWAGVSVAIGHEIFRGHVLASDLPKPADGPHVFINYRNSDFRIPPDKADELKSQAARVKTAGGAVALTAIVQKNSPPNERFLPEARIAEARILLGVNPEQPDGIPDASIVETVIEVPDKKNLPDLVVDFLLSN